MTNQKNDILSYNRKGYRGLLKAMIIKLFNTNYIKDSKKERWFKIIKRNKKDTIPKVLTSVKYITEAL